MNIASKMTMEETDELQLQFEKRGGLLPVVVQEVSSMRVLMLGYVNAEALQESLSTRMATFWSTSRQELWTKGKTSGDYLQLESVLVDCDQDALIYLVSALGNGACHTKNSTGQARGSCFYRRIDEQYQLEKLPGED